MNTNIGTLDRVLRVIAGLVLLSLLFLLDGEAKWFGLIGIVPLATAAMSWCPLYTLLGIRTCRTNGR
ncbi:YgaP family membrane protein [Zavarzinia sp.]|uniref:YgaP family membrane protein n=1 Tax=Zavarzinia sp. TaxID=2027920 RepID=UPI003BB810FD